MAELRKPLTPVKPDGMELLFAYSCPVCKRQIQVLNPIQASMARCDACGNHFPIVPVDAHTIRYMKIILAGGRAAIDPDFI